MTGAAGKTFDGGLESPHALHVIDRLVDRAGRDGARFELTVLASGWVRLRWGLGPGTQSIRVADRWRGAEGMESLLRLLEQEIDRRAPCSNF